MRFEVNRILTCFFEFLIPQPTYMKKNFFYFEIYLTYRYIYTKQQTTTTQKVEVAITFFRIYRIYCESDESIYFIFVELLF